MLSKSSRFEFKSWDLQPSACPTPASRERSSKSGCQNFLCAEFLSRSNGRSIIGIEERLMFDQCLDPLENLCATTFRHSPPEAYFARFPGQLFRNFLDADQ